MGDLITLVIIIAVPVVLVQYSTGMSAGYSAAAAVGIVVALISLSVLTSKLKRAARRKSLIGKYGSEDLVEMIMDQKIWKGMTSDQLLDSMGKPESVDQEMSARRAREVGRCSVELGKPRPWPFRHFRFDRGRHLFGSTRLS